MESLFALLAAGCGVLSLVCLFILHFVSSEFQPSWRMISEYALGKHKWLITSFFMLWSLSSVFLAILLWSEVDSFWAKAGTILLLVSAIGEFMGGAFDVKHKLHGMAFMLGIPFLPVAAVLITHHLTIFDQGIATALFFSAHSTWLSVVLMAIAMIVMITGFKKAGIPMGPDMEPPKEVPNGVIALAGYANRILVLSYVGWLILTAVVFID